MSAVATAHPEGSIAAAEALVRDRTGLVFSDARRTSFERAIAVAMQQARARTLGDYLARLAADAALLDDLVAEITVGETYFFREPRQLDVIRKDILPEVIRRRPASHQLKFWSAGCATGEEAYTLAIIARDMGLEPQPRILGTDLSRAALARAARGCYGRWSLRGVTEETVRANFDRKGEVFHLDPLLRCVVEFGYLNLSEDAYPSLANGTCGIDLILCRNVLMYFDREVAARVTRRLFDALAEGGWLLLGSSDPPAVDEPGRHVVMTEAGLAYRRGPKSSQQHATDAPDGAHPIHPSPLPPLDEPRDPSPPVTPLPPRVSPRAAPRPTGYAGDSAEQIAVVRSLINRGDLARAGIECAAAMERHRDSAELLWLHAMLLAEGGRHGESAKAARGALYLDRNLIVAHVALGTALARGGDTGGARRALRNAMRLLSALSPESVVPAADGESAARLSQMLRMRLTLLAEGAA